MRDDATPEDTVDMVTIDLEIENTYERYEDETTYVRNLEVPRPPADHESDEWGDWWDEYIYEHTGSASGNKTSGDSWYDVKIVASSDPALVGLTHDFGY